MLTGCHPRLWIGLVVLLAVGVVAWSATRAARQDGVAVGVIAGTGASDNSPEAGVWVIAEANELETKFVKSVVTDDRGRFLLPELPGATYDVWVRGYGLVDSEKVQLSPERWFWANDRSNFVWHIEGGKGTKSKIVHFQLPPDPLAR